MRITILTPSFLPAIGGAETGVAELAAGLARLGHDIDVVTAEAPGLPPGASPVDGLPYAVHRHLRYVGGHDAWGRTAWGTLRSNLDVAGRVRAGAPDVVLVFYLLPYALLALWLQSVGRTPVVASVIGRDVDLSRYDRLERALARGVMRRAAGRVFISAYAKRLLKRELAPLDGAVVPLGVSAVLNCGTPSDRARLREAWGIPPDALVAFALQRLSPVKRFDVAVEAFARFAAARPGAFLVVGGEGPERSRIEETTRRLGVERWVKLVGEVPAEEVAAHYAAADMFVFHSTFETLGLSVVEAMMAGLPVACADATATREVVRDGETGVIAAPCDADDLARALFVLADDPALRARLGRGAREEALRTYETSLVARRYEAVLLETVRRG